MAKHKYEIEAFGQKFTRTTDRVYLFAVAGVLPPGCQFVGKVWVTWHGTKLAADKEAQRRRNGGKYRPKFTQVEVVPVPQPA